jgi:hypothetical protein
MQEVFRGASHEDTHLILLVLLILSTACHCQECLVPLIFCKFCMRIAEAAADAGHGNRSFPPNSLMD